MRIGLVRGDLTAGGGAERYAGNLITKLAERGHEVHVFARCVPSALPEGTVPHLFPSASGWLKSSRLWRATQFLYWLRREQKAASLDLLFTMERTWPGDVFRAGDGVHKAWMGVFLRDAPPWRRWLVWCSAFHRATIAAERQVFNARNTRCVICNSQKVASEIFRCYGYPADRVHVVPNGVDMQTFRPATAEARASLRAARGIAPDELVLLFAGAGFWRKGLDRAIRLLASLTPMRAGRVRLLVAGKGKAAGYQRQAQRLGVAGLVDFLGAQPPAAMLPLYQVADLFVFPTRYDPFANACLEANACGVHVATTSSNGFSEHIQTGKNGMVIDSRRRIEDQALTIHEYCLRHGADTAPAVREAVAHLDLEAHVQAILHVLENLTAS